jgi:hypothetical protein
MKSALEAFSSLLAFSDSQPTVPRVDSAQGAHHGRQQDDHIPLSGVESFVVRKIFYPELTQNFSFVLD